MIKQIYHTSHCGSTLLISMLKESASVYSEPSWTHQVIQHNINFFHFIDNYDDAIVKLPSGLCHFAYQINGKKIFLYRKLKQHLFKILFQYRTNYIDYYYEYFRSNIHPSLKNIEFNTIDKMNIFLWANRIMWILEDQNITWIESNEFFLNKKKTLNLVCDYFEISKIDNIKFENIHVKSIGMNHNDANLNQIDINLNDALHVESDYGVIFDEVCYKDTNILRLLEWANKNLPFIPKYLF